MRKPLTLLAALALGAAACSDPIAPEVRAVAGSYRVRVPDAANATAYGTLHVTSTANGVVTEENVAGTEIDLVLSADGTTTGRLFVPDAPDDGGGPSADFEVPLTGTWTIAGGVVTLHHAADTFLRSMPLTADSDRLTGDQTFGGVRIQIVLARQ